MAFLAVHLLVLPSRVEAYQGQVAFLPKVAYPMEVGDLQDLLEAQKTAAYQETAGEDHS